MNIFTKTALDIITDWATIFGLGIAVWIYLQWVKDYTAQKAHEYAIEMLKKLYEIHGSIEALRGPKFYFSDTVEDNLKNIFIPKINELVSETAKVRSDFLVAKHVLLKNKNIIEKFNALITNDIIKKFRMAAYTFSKEIQGGKNYKETQLWAIIFPSECVDFAQVEENPIKLSVLGTNEEVQHDAFNKIIENNFNELYQLLAQELIQKKLLKKKIFIMPLLVISIWYCFAYFFNSNTDQELPPYTVTTVHHSIMVVTKNNV